MEMRDNIYLTRNELHIYNLLFKNKIKLFWHNLTRNEKNHCKRLFAFGLIGKKVFQARLNNRNKICYELIVNKERLFDPIQEEDIIIKDI